ncbi:MAG TPA: hypothetical protein DCQ04_13265 [Actinobacteria bacterium]|nr:hypothetical protein [Actinomycetota bacterium]
MENPFIQLDCEHGMAYIKLDEVVCVGPPYVKKKPGRPGRVKKDAAPEEEPEAKRMVGLKGGQNVWIMDTDDNMAALGIEG